MDKHQDAVEVERGLGLVEVAATIGVSPWTIRRLEARGEFPAARRVGARRIWRKSEVLNWLAGAPTAGARSA